MFKLENKTALVTGATGGIGQATARALSEQGARVILTGRREEALQELKNSIANSEYIVSDLSSAEEAGNLFNKAEEQFGAIDILVCNAGVTKDNLALRMKDEEWEEVIKVNLTATFALNKAAFKKMMKRKHGRIINISSVVAVSGNPGQANYVASKAGMIGMSKALAVESANRGITINCVAPGFIKTAMTDKLNDAQKEAILTKVPVGDLGSPEDIASGIAFLASDEAKYITGQTLHINGGMLMA